MGVEGLGDVEVVGGEGLEPGFVLVFFGAFVLAGGGDVGASGVGYCVRDMSEYRTKGMLCSRAEESPGSCQYGDKDVVVAIDMSHELRKVEEEIL